LIDLSEKDPFGSDWKLLWELLIDRALSSEERDTCYQWLQQCSAKVSFSLFMVFSTQTKKEEKGKKKKITSNENNMLYHTISIRTLPSSYCLQKFPSLISPLLAQRGFL